MSSDRIQPALASFPTCCPSSLFEPIDPDEARSVIGGALMAYLLAGATCAPIETTESGLLQRAPSGRF